MVTESFSGRKYAAIGLARRLGEKLAKDHPRVAKDWEGGMSLESIARSYLPNETDRSVDVGINAVHCAMDYLLPADKRKAIGDAHILAGSKKGGKIGGAVQGKINAENGIGFCGLTSEQLRKQGRKAAVDRGFKLYVDKKMPTDLGEMFEKDYIIGLRQAGHAWKTVAAKAEKAFGNKRNHNTLMSLYNGTWVK